MDKGRRGKLSNLSTETAHVEAAVADALLEVLQDTPDGQILASQLCINLYKKCPDAKAILQAHGGAKRFIQIPRLRDAVCYIADWYPNTCLRADMHTNRDDRDEKLRKVPARCAT